MGIIPSYYYKLEEGNQNHYYLALKFLHATYFHSEPPEEAIQTAERIAFLTPRADGLYVISSIDSLAA